MKLLLLSAFIVSYAFAACPNKCSGHGTCQLGDRCSCQPRWIGADCSQRQCAYGLSWVTDASTTTSASGSTTSAYNMSGKTSSATGATTSVTLDSTVENLASASDDVYNGMSISFLGTGISSVITAYTGASRTATIGHGVHTAIAKGVSYVIQNDGGNPDVGRHSYTECSSKGNCDRSTGECACFGGYEGRGCRRQACPNNCSGHGMCRYNHEINPRYTPHFGDEVNELQSQLWDYNKARQCLCDRGYEGYDCSMRTCPKGDDPLTDCDTPNAGGEVPDIQELSFATLTDSGYFTLTFTDMFNGNYTTRPIHLTHGDVTGGAHTDTAADIQNALMELPNFAIPNVTVSYKAHDSSTGNDYLVTFTDEANAGPQKLLVCSQASNTSDKENDNPNAQPRFKEPQATSATSRQVVCSATSQSLNIFGSNYRYKEHKECSGRGACDSTSGLCQCYEGFTGESCATQTVFF